MATNISSPAASRPADPRDDLLLRETHHRCANDLQLVVSLLSLQSRRPTSPEAREGAPSGLMTCACGNCSTPLNVRSRRPTRLACP